MTKSAQDSPSGVSRAASVFLLGFVLLWWANDVRADRIDRLISILSTSQSYKVRLQAAVSLGRLKDRRSVPALSRALRDQQFTVRAVAAAALGQIGDPSALRALKRQQRRETKIFVRGQLAKAIRILESLDDTKDGGRVLLKIGRFRNETGVGGAGLGDVLAESLRRVFSRDTSITVPSRGTTISPAQLASRRMRGFVLDGAIVKLEERPSGRDITLSCKVRVVLSTFPGNSMKAFYNGGASVAVRSGTLNNAVRRQLYRDLLGGAAEGAHQNITRSFLRNQ